MPIPKILVHKETGTLQIANTISFNSVAEKVLQRFAQEDGPGNIYLASSAGANTLIGSFTDTRYEGDIGSGAVTLISTQYDLYQDLSNNYSNVVGNNWLIWDSTNSSLQVSPNAQMSELASEVLNYLVMEEGPGSYQIGTNTPSGGTWSVIATLNNIDTSSNVATYSLFKKLEGINPLVEKPLRFNQLDSSIRLLSNTEIQELAGLVRGKIVTTGIGHYLFQTDVPGTGTWVNKGTIIDTRPTISPTDYTASYAETFITNYEGSSDLYANTISGTYTGDFAGPGTDYDGSIFTTGYTTEYDRPFDPTRYLGGVQYLGPAGLWGPAPTTFYGLVFLTSYTLEYTGTYELAPLYSSDYSSTFTGNYQGIADRDYLGAFASYTAAFDSVYLADFTQISQYSTDYALDVEYGQIINLTEYGRSYAGTTTITYASSEYVLQEGIFARDYISEQLFSASYVALNYQEFFGPSYLGAQLYQGAYADLLSYISGGFDSTFTTDYDSVDPILAYSSFLAFSGPSYTGAGSNIINYSIEVTSYGNSITYENPSPTGFYLGGYIGAGYIGTGIAEYTWGFFTGIYTGQAGFIFGPIHPVYYGPWDFTGSYSLSYGLEVPNLSTYDGIVTINYEALISDYTVSYQITNYTQEINEYIGAYITTELFTTDYTGITGYLGDSSYTSYIGPPPTLDYTSEAIYTGTTITNYEGLIEGATYESSIYAGSTIDNNSSTITTKTLWRRIG